MKLNFEGLFFSKKWSLLFLITFLFLFFFSNKKDCFIPKNDLVLKNHVTTLLMPAHSFERKKNWDKIANFAFRDETIKEFIVLWLSDTPPPFIFGAKVLQRKPVMSQRFNVSFTTEFVTVVDDDKLLSEDYHKKLLLEASKTEGLTGYDGRTFDSSGNYIFYCGGFMQPKCKLTLTSSLVIRSSLLTDFLKEKKVIDFIDAEHYCEDIMLNFFVKNKTGVWAKVVPPCGHSRIDLDDTGGLSLTIDDWASKRSACVKWARNHYKL